MSEHMHEDALDKIATHEAAIDGAIREHDLLLEQVPELIDIIGEAMAHQCINMKKSLAERNQAVITMARMGLTEHIERAIKAQQTAHYHQYKADEIRTILFGEGPSATMSSLKQPEN